MTPDLERLGWTPDDYTTQDEPADPDVPELHTHVAAATGRQPQRLIITTDDSEDAVESVDGHGEYIAVEQGDLLSLDTWR